jgi:hypothetical protein
MGREPLHRTGIRHKLSYVKVGTSKNLSSSWARFDSLVLTF